MSEHSFFLVTCRDDIKTVCRPSDWAINWRLPVQEEITPVQNWRSPVQGKSPPEQVKEPKGNSKWLLVSLQSATLGLLKMHARV